MGCEAAADLCKAAVQSAAAAADTAATDDIEDVEVPVSDVDDDGLEPWMRQSVLGEPLGCGEAVEAG